MSNESRDSEERGKDNPKEFQIQIDRNPYKVREERLSGSQIRKIPDPDIPPDRDLFEVVPGGADRKIADQDTVEIHNGKRFFTAPGRINPG